MARAMDAGQGADAAGTPAAGPPAGAEVRDTSPWGDPGAGAVGRGWPRVNGVPTLGARAETADPARPPSTGLPPGFRMVEGVGPVLGARQPEPDRTEPAGADVREADAGQPRGLFDNLPTGGPAVIGGRRGADPYAPREARPSHVETVGGGRTITNPALRGGRYQPDLGDRTGGDSGGNGR